jgi:tRNA dimethylallyltransferase
MSEKPQKSALLIAGPTASGKSALALKLVRERDGVIINADSMQVYRELRILSARPTRQEEAEAPHRLYGHVSGLDAYSTGRWLTDAVFEIEACWASGKLPIVVGGTGLYFMALLGGLAEVPPTPDAIREKWRSFSGDLHAELRRRDAISAQRLNPADRQRITRALEVLDATGKPLHVWQRNSKDSAPLGGAEVERLFIDVPREVLYARAEARLDAMMSAGALQEVRDLPEMSPSQPMMKAIGVPELRVYLSGQGSLDDAVRDAKTATRNYIKRQLTWWRNSAQDWKLIKP